mmetsp:Transcript_76723/g.194705  ORF Transcript_76723/g.194705 Transcript_76723/m.194705 type:complete len:232 (+) Transcript_76723:60-755(+)
MCRDLKAQHIDVQSVTDPAEETNIPHESWAAPPFVAHFVWLPPASGMSPTTPSPPVPSGHFSLSESRFTAKSKSSISVLMASCPSSNCVMLRRSPGQTPFKDITFRCFSTTSLHTLTILATARTFCCILFRRTSSSSCAFSPLPSLILFLRPSFNSNANLMAKLSPCVIEGRRGRCVALFIALSTWIASSDEAFAPSASASVRARIASKTAKTCSAMKGKLHSNTLMKFVR